MKARQNPFTVQRLHRLSFRPQGTDWDVLWKRLGEIGYWGAIVGPEGSGKTTLLDLLASYLPARGWQTRRVQLRRGEPAIVPPELVGDLTPRHFVLIDGAEQLGYRGWHQFIRATRRGGGCIATLHQPGRLPTWCTCETSLALLNELWRELAGDLDEAVRELNARLFTQHRGNIREVLRAWYDLCAADAPIALSLQRRCPQTYP